MAATADSSGKDEVKTQFVTREGTYRLMALSEYSRPNRVSFTGPGGAGACPVRVSLITLPPAAQAAPPAAAAPIDADDDDDEPDRICFNHGKELYVYVYRGIKKAADLTRPVEKKIYKGTNPTCHEFNPATATRGSVSLLVGFSTGQIQIIDPINKELSKLFNEERAVEAGRVTCVRWVPGGVGGAGGAGSGAGGGGGPAFVSAHGSGALLHWHAALPAAPPAPHWLRLAHGPGYAVHELRSRTARNPVRRWLLGNGACVNEMAWSPCGAKLATVGQDGFLRVFHYSSMALEGRARSYFGGFLCVAWAPDGGLVAVGGEDDLVTLWSAAERRVVARLQGHRSWVSVVAFDPWAGAGAGADGQYRLGSVAQDTQLCLWELPEDALRSAVPPPRRPGAGPGPAPQPPAEPEPPLVNGAGGGGDSRRGKREEGGLGARLGGLAGLGQRGGGAGRAARGGSPGGGGAAGGDCDPLRLMGTPLCPRFDEVPVLEPLVVKKIAHERLTALLFRPDCFLTACADGCVNTWARPVAHRPPD